MLRPKQGHNTKNHKNVNVNNSITNKLDEKNDDINNQKTTSTLNKCSIQQCHRMNTKLQETNQP